MSSIPFPTDPTKNSKSLWFKKLYALVTYSQEEMPRLAVIRRHTDYFLTLMMFMGVVFSCIQGLIFGNFALAFMLAGGIFCLSFFATQLGQGKGITMHIQAVLLAFMAAAQVHLSFGMQEFHFGFFIIMPTLLLYRKPAVILSAGGTVIALHWVMNALQQSGYSVYIFQGGLTHLNAVALHSLYVAFSIGLFSFIAHVLRQHARNSEETAKLLGNFGKADGVNFRMRAQPDNKGKLSPLGKVFNDYTDNMAFTVSTFKMLSLDIRELTAIAEQLKSGNSLRFEQVNEAANLMRDFIQQLGKQTAQIQNASGESGQLKEDCFDLVNEVNQSIEQLSRMTKQTFEANRDIQSLAADDKIPMSGELRNRLMVVAASLDHLAERTQTFTSRFEVLKSGLSAIDNQSVQIEHSISQLLEDSHNNQRKGWEVLGTMEHLQVNAEEAFAVLNNTVDTIVRADKVISEMEDRFSRFDI